MSLEPDGYFAGLQTLPMNRTAPDFLARIRNRNGWSARKTFGAMGMEVARIMTPVAAAASVPFSSTCTKALCTTS
jgi:hypothetical protein